MLEIIVSVIILLAILGSTGGYFMGYIRKNIEDTTDRRIEQLKKAFEAHYLSRVTYEAYYNNDNLSEYHERAILPTKVSADTIRAYTEDVKQAFLEAGCSVTATGSKYYNLQCKDGYDNNFHFTITNERGPVTYQDPPFNKAFDPKIPVVITITSAGSDRDFATTSDNTVGMWSSGDLDQKLINDTYNRMGVIAKSFRAFQENRILTETMQSTLTPRDAVKVPWIWQLLASTKTLSKQNCEISNLATCRPLMTCICTNYTGSVWRTAVYPAYDRSVMSRIVTNLGLPKHYIKDAFGMTMDIDILHAGHRATNLPPIPGDNYDYDIQVLTYPGMSNYGDTGYCPAVVSIKPVWEPFGRHYYVGN